MCNKIARFPKTTLVLGAAVATLLCLPCAMRAQSTTTQSGASQPSATQDRPAVQNNAGDADRGDANQDRDRREAADFNRFLDDHREIGEQVRKDPSLCDNREFLRNHPELQTYLQNNPGVRDQLRQDPNFFMRQADLDNRNMNQGGRNTGREAANFDRFLDQHREISEQVRKNPSLCDDRSFVQNHPALQAYLENNPGVRDQLRQDPNAFMRQADFENREVSQNDRDPMHDHMADFGGWLRNHPDIQKDVSKDPSCVKDHKYVQNHTELDAYLNAHPDVRTDLMANPQSFVHGAQQFGSASPSGVSSGAGVSAHSTGTMGTGTGSTGSMTGTSTNPTATHEAPKPNQ